VSLVNGEDGTPASKRGGTAGAPSVVTADNADDEDDEGDDDENVIGGRSLYESGQLDPSEHEKDSLHKSMFRKYMDVVDTLPLTDSDRNGMSVRDMGERYDVWNRSKLRTGDLRRLINQTLSQSVPANVVTVVNSYTKLFAGMLVEEAREVQAEWMAMAQKRADGEPNPAYKRLKRTYDDEKAADGEQREQQVGESSAQPNGIKKESTSPPTQSDVVMNEAHNASKDENSNDAVSAVYPGGAGGLSTSIEECDRGPLLPDHLREALRRYKKARKGGTVGFTGLSLEGREIAASRMGGRRLFR
jgi:transcription initiation factor TFIID subunit 11